MTRRRKDPFAGKENVRHFRLVHRPIGAVESENVGCSEEEQYKLLKFEDMFEEYDPSGPKTFYGNRDGDEVEVEEEVEEKDLSYDFANDEDGEMVDIDAELDQFESEFIDIEGEGQYERVKAVHESEEKVGEAAKYGILLDDRDYDYTKHLRKVGVTPGAVFIQAPGMKKSSETGSFDRKAQDFFNSESRSGAHMKEEIQDEPEIDEADLKANHEQARKKYKALLHQVVDDPMLREVIEALEDDRYVTEEFDDQLVLSLDNMNLLDKVDDFFGNEDEDIDILDENDNLPDFIPSEALKRQMAKIAQMEAEYEQEEDDDEFDQILNEYEDENYDEEIIDEEEYIFDDGIVSKTKNKSVFVDIEGEDDEIQEIDDEEASKIYAYLREHGRARGSTIYDKKRPAHLPPIHIAIAQYDQVRRELAVDKESIIQKYAVVDEEEAARQLKESEKIIEQMVKIIDAPEEMDKRLNIETAKYLLKSENGDRAGPKKIVESRAKKSSQNLLLTPLASENDSESEDVESVINKGVARSTDETAEEKKARKAKIKAEKREKRAEKKIKNNNTSNRK